MLWGTFLAEFPLKPFLEFIYLNNTSQETFIVDGAHKACFSNYTFHDWLIHANEAITDEGSLSTNRYRSYWINTSSCLFARFGGSTRTFLSRISCFASTGALSLLAFHLGVSFGSAFSLSSFAYLSWDYVYELPEFMRSKAKWKAIVHRSRGRLTFAKSRKW